jgi:NADPH-dependent 2,4-dienoyl-CoA reductase/sulfur reductase-like enzyme
VRSMAGMMVGEQRQERLYCRCRNNLTPVVTSTSFGLLTSFLPFHSIHRIMGKKVAIVGSGVSGIGALWALKGTGHEVHLYEAGARLGGHTNTVTFEGPNGKKTNVDAGFIVFNTVTYR